MQTYYNNINYDYPTCGGVKVTKGRKYWTVTHESNYQGNHTGDTYKCLISDGDTAKSIADDFARCPDDFICVKRGILVQ